MGPRLKTFSLDDATMAIVKTKPNQSQWIRTLILEEDDYPRADLKNQWRIQRAALRYACSILRTMQNETKGDVIVYLEKASEDNLEAWEQYEQWDSDGHGVDWFIDRVTQFARDEMP